MRILNTRPVHEADEFSARLRADGHKVISSPMLAITYTEFAPIDTRGLQALIITSPNALRALKRDGQISRLTELPLFAVGPSSAKLARAMGFGHVEAGPAGALELSKVIVGKARTDRGRLVHLCGDVRAFDIEGELGRHGFNVETVKVYRSDPVDALNPEALKALADGTLEAVTLMSPRTAKTFVSLVIAAGLRDQARQLDYACISDATARAIGGLDLPADRVHVPGKPSSADLLALVNRI